MGLSVTLIDYTDAGHHPYYAGVLAEELRGHGISVYAVGSRGVVEMVAAKGNPRDVEMVPLRAGDDFERESSKHRYLVKCLRVSSRFRSNIIHLLCLDRFSFALSRTLATGFSGKVRATIHQAYFMRQFATSFVQRAKAFFIRRCIERLASRGVRLMVHSREMARRLEQDSGRKQFDYIPYPVAFPSLDCPERRGRKVDLRGRLGIPADRRLLLCFGGTRYEKGCDLAIRGLALLPRNYHLLITGAAQGFGERELKRVARIHGVSDRVTLDLRFVPEATLVHYFSAADLALLPYRRTFAGQSGPLTIAASLGVPVVGADVLVLQETIHQYALGATFPCEDLKRMAQAIEAVCGNRIEPCTEKFVRDHSGKAFAEAVIRSYHL